MIHQIQILFEKDEGPLIDTIEARALPRND